MTKTDSYEIRRSRQLKKEKSEEKNPNIAEIPFFNGREPTGLPE